MNYICRNIDNASKVKILPSVMFSPPLAKYVNEVADVHSVHPDSLAIVLINCVAATLEFSYVLRSNCSANQIPTNIYNMVVARSSYGKSDLTRLLRDMLKSVADNRSTKFCSAAQISAGELINPTLDEMSRAGLISALDDCTRMLVCDEADMTFSDVGLFLTNSTYRTSPEMNCRGLVTSLFDRVSHPYVRQLANRTILVKRSKLNILGCSTGDIISSMVIRMKSGATFDPSIGRFLFWALDGPVIPDKLKRRNIDNSVFPTLNQFVVVLSFIENTIFEFDLDAVEAIVEWGNSYKTQSYDERNNNECLSARMGKSVQHAYRFAAFLQTLEIGFSICELFIQSHQYFPANGIIGTDFVAKVASLYHSKYSNQFAQNSASPFLISKEVVLRAIDTITGNMHQFMLLFDSTNAPRISAVGRQVIVVSPEQQHASSNIQDSSLNKKQLKKKQRNDFNFNRVAVAMILYPSVCFTIKQLHQESSLHNSGGIRLKDVAKTLTDSDVLIVCSHGIRNASKTTPVFIKQLPPEDEVDEDTVLQSALSEYTKDGQPVSLASYKNSCNLFSLLTDGVVHNDIYRILSQPEYSTCAFYESLRFRNSTTDQTPSSTNDGQSAADSVYEIVSVMDDPDQRSVAPDILSPLMHETDAFLSMIPVNEQQDPFENINLDQIALNIEISDIISAEEQSSDLNLHFAPDSIETSAASIIAVPNNDKNDELKYTTNGDDRQRIHSSAETITSHEQNRNANEILSSNKRTLDKLNDSFCSPPSCRTRLKLRKKNKVCQRKNVTTTTVNRTQTNHRKRIINKSYDHIEQ
ncbi:unnamed protein product [Adineta ricciae]|uniref:Uncharacterized protein n=1 Tax=Adineta ricciae TaxID=249248 RepID=A0A814XB87_ADIRI|nr:unnamed protein product [Adineta ricciae]CAF1313409.1 unnamed protein product [Adineta ricciae]